jgi:signal transduction histidine kinase
LRARLLRERDEVVTRLIQQEIEARNAAQLALQQSRELAVRQERLAHEFNNILTIIQGHASLLLDKPDLDDQSVKSIAQITHGVERIAALVKQMTAFSLPDDPARPGRAALDDALRPETAPAPPTLSSAR